VEATGLQAEEQLVVREIRTVFRSRILTAMPRWIMPISASLSTEDTVIASARVTTAADIVADNHPVMAMVHSEPSWP
jgi:hypothetical protein